MWRHILPFRCNVSRRIFSIAIVHKHGGLFRDGAHICSSNTGKSKINFNQFLINQKIYFPLIINEKCGCVPTTKRKSPKQSTKFNKLRRENCYKNQKLLIWYLCFSREIPNYYCFPHYFFVRVMSEITNDEMERRTKNFHNMSSFSFS